MSRRRRTAVEAFRQGVLSAFDIGLRARPQELVPRSSQVDDARAIAGDWRKVIEDLKAAAAAERKAEQAGTDGEAQQA